MLVFHPFFQKNRIGTNLTDIYPIFLLSLQLFDTLQEALFGTVKLTCQAANANVIRLLVRSRHLDINLDKAQFSLQEVLF